ncbi:MAG: hypothetical protein OK474_02375 [Thaumarchaeota archaeon]|nr:hypothetical protein [Nitrososphaerota archaeon]
MQKIKVAVYGLTTEGYSLASKMVEKASVTIVDDTLQMAMDLNPATVKGNPTLQELVGGESLIGLKPVSQVLTEARVVFFTPKLRKTGDESVTEASGKMREVAKNVTKGTTVVNGLPVGVGGNNDNIALIEKQTGLKIGENLNYGYCPLRPGGEPGVVACVANMKESGSLDDLGIRSSYGTINATEIDYVSTVLNESTSVATEIELMRKAKGSKPAVAGKSTAERYIDDLASHVYDLTAIQASEDVGEPLTYLAVAAIKSLENHVRYIVDETRDLLRELQLKASRTRVLVAWSVDRYEMRADRIKTAENLVERLRDYVTDVKHAQMSAGREEVIDSYKHNIAIVCSQRDLEWMKGLKSSSRASELSLLRATPTLQRG